ncbi:MAG: PAS domain S-box protein [Pseudomonadota bacterium]
MIDGPQNRELEAWVKKLEIEAIERDRLLNALRESEERYQRIVVAINAYIYTVQIEDGVAGRTIHGPGCLAITGYTPEDFSNNPYLWIQMVCEEDRKAVEDQAARRLSGQPTALEHRIIRKDGALRWVRNTPVAHYDGRGRLVSYDGLIQDITDRKEAEEALLESEEKYKQIAENSIDAVGMSQEGRIVYANHAFSQIFGYSQDELIGKDITIAVAPEHRQLIEERAQKRFKGIHVPNLYEFEGLKKNGERVSIEVSSSDAFIYKNKPTILAILRDVTARKRAEAALKFRIEFDNLVTHISTEFISIPSHKLDNAISCELQKIGLFVGADRSYVFLFNKDATGMSNSHEWCADEIEPQIDNLQDIRVEDLPWFSKRIKGREVFHVPFVDNLPPEAALEKRHFQDQDIKSLVVLPMVYAGSVIGFFGLDSVHEKRTWTEDIILLLRIVGEIFANALARRCAEEALRESEKKYSTLVEGSPTGIFVEQDGRIVFANNRFAEIYGYAGDELPGSDLRCFDGFEMSRLSGEKALTADEITAGYEIKCQKTDGRVIWIKRRDAEIEYRGRPAILANVLDITEQKKAQEELQRMNKELEDFVNIVSHDLKTPIISVQGFSTRLLETCKAELGEKGRNYLQHIRAAASRMELLVSDLLVLSKIGRVASSFRIVSSFEIVQRLAAALHDRLSDRNIDLQIGANLPDIYCDGERVYQVFENLLVNAIKFVREAENPVIKIDCNDKERFHEFYVRDNGIGIDPKYHHKIFEMFHRLDEMKDEEGTGLGLAIVERITSNHGGKVWVESDKGEGATFYFSVPKAIPALSGTDSP